MRNWIKNWLGRDILDNSLTLKALEELSIDQVKVVDRMRRVEKDMADILIYLDVERKEEWKEDEKSPLNMPRLITSKWIKKHAKNSPKSSSRASKR